jgi:hypothetical protein
MNNRQISYKELAEADKRLRKFFVSQILFIELTCCLGDCVIAFLKKPSERDKQHIGGT